MAQIKVINNSSRQVSDEVSRLENLLARVKHEWCGPASEAYQNELVKLITELKNVKLEIDSISQTVDNVANAIRQGDEHLAKSMLI